MKRLTLTQHTVRCPLDDRAANLTVRTDSNGYPSRRYLDVTACSLLPSTSFLPEVACPKRCLPVMNAAESGAAEPVRCTSGVSDSLELARQTQSPTIMRLLWFYGA
jgi:hypothetical protein